MDLSPAGPERSPSGRFAWDSSVLANGEAQNTLGDASRPLDWVGARRRGYPGTRHAGCVRRLASSSWFSVLEAASAQPAARSRAR